MQSSRVILASLSIVSLVVLALGLTPESARTASRPASRSTAKPVLPFIHDDYAKALAEARARKLPLFIESWAPW